MRGSLGSDQFWQYYARDASSGRVVGRRILLVMRQRLWILDVLVVVSFAVIGRDTHGFSSDWEEVARISAPFLIALIIGFIVTRVWSSFTNPLVGLVLGSVTLVVGMLLRRFVFDDGTAPVFVWVAAGWFIGVMVAWRLIAIGVRYLRTR